MTIEATGVTEDAGFDERWLGAYILKDQWHFHRRLLLRYGIVLEPGEFTKIVADMADGTAILIKQDPKARIYAVRIRRAGQPIYVVASGARIITALPPNRIFNRIRRKLVKASKLPVAARAKRKPIFEPPDEECYGWADHEQ